MRVLRFVSALLILTAACGSDGGGAGGGGGGPGAVCETTDECGGLKCVSPRSTSSGTCDRTGTDICSDFCSDANDQSCAKLSADMKCVVQCDGIGICMKP